MRKAAPVSTAKRERAREIFRRLEQAYPKAHCTLDYHNPLELLIMTILAAQCTDARVNIVAKSLFRKYRTADDFVHVPVDELAEDIRSTGFFRQKAKSIVSTCRILLEEHGGDVPANMEALTRLPGVGRKTANVVLGECFGHQGVIVDTHCTRLANRLGFTQQQDAGKIEQDLMKLWPPEHWTMFSHYLVYHGRAVCAARTPRCAQCVLLDLCAFPKNKEGKKRAR